MNVNSFRKKEKKNYILLGVLLLLLIGVGYAAIGSELNINGTATVRSTSFDVHFENITIDSGSVDINSTSGDSAATISATDNTKVDYTVTLEEPGDYYEFTVDAVNAGSMDAMISAVESKLNGSAITTLPAYLGYTVTYSDGVAIASPHELDSGTREKYKVRVEFKTDIENTDLPSTTQTLTFSFKVTYVQKDNTAISKPQASTYKYRVSTNSIYIGDTLTGTTYENANDAISAIGHNFLLRHKVENDVVTESYVGFVYNGNIYYIRGAIDERSGSSTPIYESNKEVMQSAFGSDKCTDYTSSYKCHDSEAGLYVIARVYGYVNAYDGSWYCHVTNYGYANCYEKAS